MCLGGARESVSKQHFLVIVPQPIGIGFCLWKRWAIIALGSFSLGLIDHFLTRHFLAKCSFHSSICSPWSCRCGRLKEIGRLATSTNIQKLIQQTFREEYQTNIHVLWNLHPGYTMIRWCNVCFIEFSITHVGMHDVADECSVQLSEYVHYA